MAPSRVDDDFRDEDDRPLVRAALWLTECMDMPSTSLESTAGYDAGAEYHG